MLQKLRITRGDRTKKPRAVWNNPIAWREAKTKASAARASMLRYGFIVAGVAGALVLLVMFASTPTAPPKYIDRNSFDAGARTLFVNGEQTYGILPTTKVTLNGKETTQDALRGHYEVTSTEPAVG